MREQSIPRRRRVPHGQRRLICLSEVYTSAPLNALSIVLFLLCVTSRTDSW